MFWRDITLSVWRKKTTGLKTKKRLLPLVLAAALCSSPVWAEEATFTANFKDTDLKSFIETVGANLNKTIIMGPGVQGKVSIRTMTPLNERQYYQLFLNLLEAQGYAVVPMENDVLKVVKSSAAKVEPLPLVGEGSDNYAGDEMVTKVVPVRNVSVRELAPILRQMIDSAGSGNVVNYDPSNVIMLTGRASVVERLTEVIQRVDHAGNDGELIVLGGLMDDQAGESVAKVPLLGDIPLIGNLFKSTADKKEKRNLMVFIRPTILRDGMAADGVSQRKYNYMRAEQIYRDEQGLSLMPHTAQPVLPAQNQALPPEVRAFLNAGRTR
ncbi:TPA: secretin N-terminal domain-containing protein [Escherichia coli]